jgi:eukaryotic-like serine/threonine-protein kinase
MDRDAVPGNPGGWVLPGYVHDRELGSGAVGRVVLARHEETGTPVAIKYLVRTLRADREFRTAYRHEAELLGELRSEHVARLYEYVEGPHGAAIVMEFVEGIALRALLREEGAASPEAALTVLKGSLLGLAAAHEAGVVHRDYKPENVLVTPQGVSKLVDFGIAARSGAKGIAAGTPIYMAPEQFAGRPATAAADVYAATATFFECVTGSRPYSGTTAMELMIQHNQAPIPDDLAPEPVRPLIRAGLAKEPGERPPSARRFVEELEQVARSAYGEDWQERGRRALATVTAALPLLLLSTTDTPPSGTTALATTDLGAATAARSSARLLRRTLAGAGAAVVIAAGFAALAAASGRGDTQPTAAVGGATTGATTSVTSSPTGPAASVAAAVSVPASAASSATPGRSPTSAAKATAPATGSAGQTSRPPSTGSSTQTAAPTSAAASSPAPQLHVYSVGFGTDQPSCSGRAGITVLVDVSSDGAATGTLTLLWYTSDTPSGARTPVDTQPITLPQGKTTVSNSYSYDFPSGAGYWGVAVSTQPTADSGNGSSQYLLAATCEIQ